MRKKVLISSILTIALCISLIAGSTFALFTSTSQVNVAVTSGKVSVVATASGLELGSTLGDNLPETLAAADGNTITLDKMVPGDFITFTITIHNDSDVTVKYRTLFAMTSGNESFFNALKITVDQQLTEDVPTVFALNDDAAPAVATPAGTMLPGCADIVLNVKVELPESAGNEHQEKSCAFAYIVEAVQGNGEFDDSRVYVYTIEELRAAVAADNGKMIVLAADIDFPDSTKLEATHKPEFSCMLKIVNDANLDLNGHTISYSGGQQCAVGLFVDGDATLNLYDSSAAQTGTVTGNDPEGGMMVAVRDRGTANIYGGNFKVSGGDVIYKASSGSTLNFYGGKVEVTSNDYTTMLNVNGNNGVITVYGGSFKKFQPGVNNAQEVIVASGYKVVRDGDWYNVVPE